MPFVKNLLATGGLGFIGSHTVVEIIQRTETNVVIVDNLLNCYEDVWDRIQQILLLKLTKEEVEKRIRYHKIDITDRNDLDSIFELYEKKGESIDGIMHFASLKAVGQSMKFPLEYFDKNVGGAVNLFRMMEKYPACKNFVFSSTSTVYGPRVGAKETDQKNPVTPYGQSKTAIEYMMAAMAKVHLDWKVVSLRYFNPCGAHESGLLGDEPPKEYPNNLFPYLQEVISGKKEHLVIFGNDYDNPDGTCIRDYVHISDLANGHLLVFEYLEKMEGSHDIFNLGTEKGSSVLEIVKAMEEALGKPIPHVFGPRREGDVGKIIATSEKIRATLGWKPQKNIHDVCRSVLNFIAHGKRYQKGEEKI